MNDTRLPLIRRMIVVTNRQIFIKQYGTEKWLPPFLDQIRFLASLNPRMIVLREKDMDPEAYLALAGKVQDICRKAKVPFAVHFFEDAAQKIDAEALHLPLWKLIRLREEGFLSTVPGLRFGTSVHSPEEAVQAEALGASWLFAGNVYETTCKEGLAGKGLDYLRAVSSAVSLPVYGIGGISLDRMEEILSAGATGGCMMSGFMTLKPEEVSE